MQVDYVYMLGQVNFCVLGVMLCLGLLGVWVDNDLFVIVCVFVDCIYFVYLCNVMCDVDMLFCFFFEDEYLVGGIDMVQVIVVLLIEEKCCCDEGCVDYQIFMCFDYGQEIFDDLMCGVQFGYLVIGCLKGLVELCGIEVVLFYL